MLVDLLDVAADGVFAEVVLVGDLLGGLAVEQAFEDTGEAWRQVG